MKHIFVANPNAGKGSVFNDIKAKLSMLDNSIDYELYPTQCARDAEIYIKHWCSEHPDTKVRFYACGGDGTINEVVNGIVGFSNASFTVYPCGSGNDFVKAFGQGEAFLDIDALVSGTEVPIDVMKAGDRYCVNVCNFGFDSNVVNVMEKVKRKPVIGGKNAYITGVVVSFITAMKNNAVVIADGEKISNDSFLLCTIANGQYVGGKFRCSPKAKVNDGFMDVCLVDTVSRYTFISLVGKYKSGQHLDDKNFEPFIRYKLCKNVEIIADDSFKVSLDGELVPAPHMKIEILHNAIKMAVPQSIAQKQEFVTTDKEMMI